MVCSTTSVNAQKSVTFKFSATVEKYIEVSSCTVNVGEYGSWNHTILDPALVGNATLSGFPVWKTRLPNNVYANCPFTVSFAGSSIGSDLPILSRTEINGDIVDRLQTAIVIRTEINGYWNHYLAGHEVHDMSFVSNPEGANTGTYTNQSCSFLQAPHNGEVRTEIFLSAALPHKTPDFATTKTANQSADAGEYTAQVIATYVAI